LCSPKNSVISPEEDFILPNNITLVPQPNWQSTLDHFKHIYTIKQSYKRVISQADHVFVRGNPVAATSYLYSCCAKFNKPICHWLVGNPMVLLNSHKRENFIKNLIGKLYIWRWEQNLLRGRARTHGIFLCNGQEIAARYSTPETHAIVSTTLTASDIYYRKDTCNGKGIQLLCLCYIRPEKGIEYLIEATAQLKYINGFHLIIAGNRDRYPQYQAKLNYLVQKYSLYDYITWTGHVTYQNTFKLMQKSDIFVLPTLSEGTPRVLVEARANGLPVIATNVGGIPYSVTNGFDGILVPSKDSFALAGAISDVIKDNHLRRRLIANGYKTVQALTINNFVQFVIRLLNESKN